MDRSSKKRTTQTDGQELLHALERLTQESIPAKLKLGAQRQITRIKLGVYEETL